LDWYTLSMYPKTRPCHSATRAMRSKELRDSFMRLAKARDYLMVI